MTDHDDVPGWDGYNVRSDRMQVVRRPDETWVIVPHDDRPEIDTCLCCDKPFATARNAKLMANAVYPPPGMAEHPLLALFKNLPN